jgi:leader peptidase (prepilin peptidase) / N-methyltransferase
VTAALTWTRARPLGACFAALLAGGVLARYGVSAAGLIAAATTAVLVVLSLIDVQFHRLPNHIVLPSAAFVLTARLVTQPDHWQAWLGASLGTFACFLVFGLIVPASLGMGDVKLMLLLGASLGAAVLPALLLGVLAGGVAGVVVLVREGRGARHNAMAYGPFLAFGAITVMLLHAP